MQDLTIDMCPYGWRFEDRAEFAWSAGELCVTFIEDDGRHVSEKSYLLNAAQAKQVRDWLNETIKG